jgi:two-component system chemotaxis response regulator CheB
VVIAASAGGLNALTNLLTMLPNEFVPAIVIVLHSDPNRRSQLAEILNRVTKIPVKQADDGELLKPGQIYLAPPNWHMLVNHDRTVSLNQSDQVHFLRPSADVLFQSAAESYGRNVLAVVLTGNLSDGTVGAQAIKLMGGTVIVQDKATSDYFGMPGSVIRAGLADQILPIQDISAAMMEWSLQESTHDPIR